MKGSIHHFEINVRNLKRSRNFWEWLLVELGYRIYQEWNCGFSFKLNDTYLVFVQVEEKYAETKYNRKNVGLNHIAFHAGSKQIVDDIVEKMTQRNINILYPHKHPFAGGTNYYAAYFEDPDRIKVEITI